MDSLKIKYATYSKAVPPQQTRVKVPGWAGIADKMEDGSAGQPWHCMPFVEASTYGLELIYPFETECQIINENGLVRIEWEEWFQQFDENGLAFLHRDLRHSDGELDRFNKLVSRHSDA